MKEVIYNEYNLTINDIDEREIRTKALMVNCDNFILMGYYKKVYQFPGGHLVSGETLEECLRRELKEETGMNINTDNLRPFYCIKYFEKDYNGEGSNRLSEVYYYILPTNEHYHLHDTNYDPEEIKGNFELKYVDVDRFEEVIKTSVGDMDPLCGVITRDNIEVMREYKKIVSDRESNTLE